MMSVNVIQDDVCHPNWSYICKAAYINIDKLEHSLYNGKIKINAGRNEMYFCYVDN